MQIESPSILETQLTGYIGTASTKVRGVTYSVRFTMQAGAVAALPTRNGIAVDWSPITVRLARNGAKFFAGVA